jgi:hypothetical protein
MEVAPDADDEEEAFEDVRRISIGSAAVFPSTSRIPRVASCTIRDCSDAALGSLRGRKMSRVTGLPLFHAGSSCSLKRACTASRLD